MVIFRIVAAHILSLLVEAQHCDLGSQVLLARVIVCVGSRYPRHLLWRNHFLWVVLAQHLGCLTHDIQLVT